MFHREQNGCLVDDFCFEHKYREVKFSDRHNIFLSLVDREKTWGRGEPSLKTRSSVTLQSQLKSLDKTPAFSYHGWAVPLAAAVYFRSKLLRYATLYDRASSTRHAVTTTGL